MKVDNKTIIITDPCYIIRKDNRDDWDKCDCGDNMEALGINNYLCSSTLYGDWSCTTYDSNTGDVLGRFCADAGLVAVFLLDEVLAYNPNFDYHISKPWTTTIIPDFTGNVDIKVIPDSDLYEGVVSVIGKGNVNFYTRQTGF